MTLTRLEYWHAHGRHLDDVLQEAALTPDVVNWLTSAVESAEALVEWDNLPDTPRLRSAAAVYRRTRLLTP